LPNYIKYPSLKIKTLNKWLSSSYDCTIKTSQNNNQLASGFNDERHIDMVDDSLYKNLLYNPLISQILLKKTRELLDHVGSFINHIFILPKHTTIVTFP